MEETRWRLQGLANGTAGNTGHLFAGFTLGFVRLFVRLKTLHIFFFFVDGYDYVIGVTPTRSAPFDGGIVAPCGYRVIP